MVVAEIHVDRLEVLEAEHDPPIAIDPHWLSAAPIPLQRMQPIPGRVHVARGPYNVEIGQDPNGYGAHAPAGFSRLASPRSQGLRKPAWMVFMAAAVLHGMQHLINPWAARCWPPGLRPDSPKTPIVGSLTAHLKDDPRESARFGAFLKEVL